MPTYDAKEFYDGLVASGLLVPAGPLGAFGRGAVFEDVLERVDALIVAAAKHDGAESMTFPPVIDRSIIEKTGYMDSFPTLCGAIHSFVGTEREARSISSTWLNFRRGRSPACWPRSCSKRSISCQSSYETKSRRRSRRRLSRTVRVGTSSL